MSFDRPGSSEPEAERTQIPRAPEARADKTRIKRQGGSPDDDEWFEGESAPRPRRLALLAAAVLVLVIGGVLFLAWPQVSQELRARLGSKPRVATRPADTPGRSVVPETTPAASRDTTAGALVVEAAPIDDQAASAAPGTGTMEAAPRDEEAQAAATVEASPPPASAPEPVEPSEPAGDTAYFVHVASYRTDRQAAIEIASLRRRGYVGRALQVDLGTKGVWIRVCAGPYATAAEARSARDALRAFPGYEQATVRRMPRG